jgi:hypothetical protein
MKTRAAVALLALLALVTAACSRSAIPVMARGGEMPRSIIDPYLKIQTTLVGDSTEGIRANAGDVANAATALGAPAAKIHTAALQLASAGGLDEAREKFGKVSEAIDAYMTGSSLKAPQTVRMAYCPMAQKPWLQQDGPLANPYYGKSMPGCGSFR